MSLQKAFAVYMMKCGHRACAKRKKNLKAYLPRQRDKIRLNNNDDHNPTTPTTTTMWVSYSFMTAHGSPTNKNTLPWEQKKQYPNDVSFPFPQ